MFIFQISLAFVALIGAILFPSAKCIVEKKENRGGGFSGPISIQREQLGYSLQQAAVTETSPVPERWGMYSQWKKTTSIIKNKHKIDTIEQIHVALKVLRIWNIL